jgi:hypothetical protein
MKIKNENENENESESESESESENETENENENKNDNENEKVCHFFWGPVAVCAAGAHNFNPPFEIPDGTTHRGSQSLN